jgi:hypothetical protein
VVFFLFPKSPEEKRLLAEFAAEDAEPAKAEASA